MIYNVFLEYWWYELFFVYYLVICRLDCVRCKMLFLVFVCLWKCWMSNKDMWCFFGIIIGWCLLVGNFVLCSFLLICNNLWLLMNGFKFVILFFLDNFLFNLMYFILLRNVLVCIFLMIKCFVFFVVCKEFFFVSLVLVIRNCFR